MSELRVETISNNAGTGPVTLTGQVAAKASLSYDQETPSILKSENVSSVTDNATGDSQVNFTNSFSDALYQIAAGCAKESATGVIYSEDNEGRTGRATSAVDMVCYSAGNGATEFDRDQNVACYFGDLA